MDTSLLKIRLVSFGWSLLSLVVAALIGVVASDEFRALITANFGNGAIASIILLFLPELVKHLRNLKVVKQLGGDSKKFLV